MNTPNNIIVITGGETNHKYFATSISRHFSIQHIYKIHSGMSDLEFFSKQFGDYSGSNNEEKLIKNEVLNRKYSHEKYLLPQGDEFPSVLLTHFYDGSILNSNETVDKIVQDKPSQILLYGAPLLTKRFINSISCPIINLHMGVMPKYRGGKANYWALYNNDYGNVGYTIHHVSEKPDAGKIIHVGKFSSYVGKENYHRICTVLLQDAVLNLIRLIPVINEVNVDAEVNLSDYPPNNSFTFEHLRKIYLDFDSLKHVKS